MSWHVTKAVINKQSRDSKRKTAFDKNICEFLSLVIVTHYIQFIKLNNRKIIFSCIDFLITMIHMTQTASNSMV
jgi:hypothetical protein